MQSYATHTFTISQYFLRVLTSAAAVAAIKLQTLRVDADYSRSYCCKILPYLNICQTCASSKICMIFQLRMQYLKFNDADANQDYKC